MHDQLFETLRHDHQEVRSIFKQLLDTEDNAQREELLHQLHQEMLPHMRAEERTLYSSVREHCRDCQEDALESMEEHHAARLVLHELEELSPNDERFRAKTMVLREMVEHHLREEEHEIFDDVRKSFSDQEAGEILKRFQEEKERVKKRMH